MTLAVTKAFYITITSAGFVLATAYPLTGNERTATLKHHADYVSVVLPEVLRNPIAYFITNKNEKQCQK
jgi:hypothetical protein